MTTTTFSAYYCRVCEAISAFASEMFTSWLNSYKIIALSRAAADLALAGYHEQAEEIGRDISRLTGRIS